MRIAIVVALVGLAAGCTTTQTQPGRVAEDGLEQARRACQADYDSGRLPTREARAKCINDAENRLVSNAASRQAMRQQQALRLDLARKVDRGQLTQAQADAQYTAGMRRITGQPRG